MIFIRFSGDLSCIACVVCVVHRIADVIFECCLIEFRAILKRFSCIVCVVRRIVDVIFKRLLIGFRAMFERLSCAACASRVASPMRCFFIFWTIVKRFVRHARRARRALHRRCDFRALVERFLNTFQAIFVRRVRRARRASHRRCDSGT